jgi:AraC-like DNA-binding protein
MLRRLFKPLDWRALEVVGTAQPHIRSGLLAELEDYIQSCGQDFGVLARKAGLASVAQPDPLAQFPLNAVMALFDLAARELHDPGFGLSFAAALRPGGSGLIGEMILNSPTVRDGLISVRDFIGVFMHPFVIDYDETGGIGRMVWSYPTTATAPRVQFNLFIVAALLRRIRAATGREWMPLSVELEHVAPACAQAITANFGLRVRFNAPTNAFSIDAQTLALAMPEASPMRFAIMQNLAGRLLAETDTRPEIVNLARAAISARLKEGQPALDAIAGQIGLTPGALQWRLEQAGTTFEKVVNDERRNQAENLLRNTDRSLTEIAFDLGFSDPSAFSRAANRWFGVSPRDWRKRERNAPQ